MTYGMYDFQIPTLKMRAETVCLQLCAGHGGMDPIAGGLGKCLDPCARRRISKSRR